MKILVTLFFSCASVLAADPGIRIATSTTTNAESASITTTEVFTRDGQTNLVRQTSTRAGVVRVRVHWFYRDGARLATYVVGPDSSAFVPESGSRYAVSLEFGPSKEVSYASIGKNDGYILDGFTCTNGVFHPDDLSHINELNAMFEQATGGRFPPVSHSPPSFPSQVLGFVVQLVLILGTTWWLARRARVEFRVSRVLIVSAGAAVCSGLLFAVWWWLTPHETERQSWLLLAATFIPLYGLIAWGVVIARRSHHKKHEHSTAEDAPANPGRYENT